MYPLVRSFLAFVGLMAFVSLVFFLFPNRSLAPTQNPPSVPISTTTTPKEAEIAPQASTTPAPPPTPKVATTVTNTAMRITNPYPFPAHPQELVTNIARSALVNIFCTSNNPGFQSISGSGVIIDPRGVVLTNAHVAQHVLLSSRPDLGITCAIRSGSPALSRWTAIVLYIPPAWVKEHVQDIRAHVPTTGEHDYALLLISQPNSLPLPPPLPYIPIDTREAVAFPGDEVVIASYPAEFLGSINAQFNLHPISSIAPISQLHTFHVKSADILSLGGIAEAQSGSSGGPVVNMWGQLVGLITATSAGDTIAGRDLRALSLSYINRDLGAQAGATLSHVLSGDIVASALDFNLRVAPALLSLYFPTDID